MSLQHFITRYMTEIELKSGKIPTFFKNACISKKIVFLELGSPLHCEIWTVGTSSANLGMYRGILEIIFCTMRGQKWAKNQSFLKPSVHT